MTWSSFIRSAPACGHAVHVYEEPGELAASVRAFLDAGFAQGQPAVVIAGAELARAIDGPDGLLTILDAEETLETFMVGGAPSPQLFEATVGGVLDAVAAQARGRTIRAFGEMVDVLWHRGEQQAALALEGLWNELANTRAFALLCGYRLDIFDVGVQRDELPEILRLHSHARPGNPARLAAAVDQAVAETLGPRELAKVYLEVAEHVPRGTVPRAQAVLGWVSAHRPEHAGALLQRARALYAG
jgi:hypothetical protein